MVTVSDRRIATQHSTYTDSIAFYTADVLTAQDYYAFGSPMPGRKYSNMALQSAYDSCVQCSTLKTYLDDFLAGSDSLTDTLGLKAHLDSALGMVRKVQVYLSALRGCGLIQSYMKAQTVGTLKRWNSYMFGAREEYRVGSNDFSLEAWVYLDDTTGSECIISKLASGGTNIAYGFIFSARKGRLYLQLNNGSTTSTGVYAVAEASTPMSLQAWHHVVAIRKGNSPLNWQFWVDGVKQTTVVVSSKLSNGNIDSINTMNIEVASETHVHQTFFNGRLHDVRFYTRSMDSGEMSLATTCPLLR